MQEPLFVITPSVPAYVEGDRFFLDEKAVSGLHLYSQFWPGILRCVFRAGEKSSIGFGRWHTAAELPFEIAVIPENSQVPDNLITGADVVLASGDNWLDFGIADQGERLGVPVCYVIENILSTRISILLLSNVSLLKKAKSLVWTIQKEAVRRRAFMRARSIQSNGFPAADAYQKYARDTLTFFDTRLSSTMMATQEDIARKIDRILGGAPIRLVYTGRLERLKGADQLIEVVRRLKFPFSLDIFGAGDLASKIRQDVARFSLSDHVRVHEPIDFERELVPKLRAEADLFLCCHVQSDPSCTYLETLGCGVPVLGYANKAWAGINTASDVGWVVPIGRPDLMADRISHLQITRTELAEKMRRAYNFGKEHSFEEEFRKRVQQLISISKFSSDQTHPAVA
jgi:glycosyltransferase involved in cell wall biosynthesis